MHELKIDFTAFFRHHYWVGWYHWHVCMEHQYSNSDCDECCRGKWKFITGSPKADGHRTHKLFSREVFSIFKMPMNGVEWSPPVDKG